MTFLRRAWLWVSAAGLACVVILGMLWRRAVGQRDAARVERDLARKSAERERVLVDEHRQLDVAVVVAKKAVEAPVAVAEVVARKETAAARSAPIDELNRRIDEELVQ